MTLRTIRIGLFFLFMMASAFISADSLPDKKAKAALLYNFMKNTEWPNEKNIKVFNVHFIGNTNSYYDEFNEITNEVNIRGRKIIATKSSTFDRNKKQHVLVASSEHNDILKDIAATLVRSGTLLISDNAEDPKLVMINFVYPKPDAIRFEINTSNIVYDGLKISNDVLLHGGTAIEVATLYKEMEFLLRKIKDEVEQNKKDLKLKLEEINTKNSEIQSLKKQAEIINQQLTLQNTEFKAQQDMLLLLNDEFLNVKNSLNTNKDLLEKREQLVKALEVEIDKKQETLKKQKEQINIQQKIVAEKSEKVSSQSATISSQRNIIVIALFLLLLFLLLIINRQKQALIRERQLLETRAELIKAQAEVITAYESSLKLKNDFLTAISHEMRTPMNGIIGAVQIANTNDPTSLALVMEIISKSSSEMLTLVDDILAYIEIQSEQIEVKNEPVNTVQLFDALRKQYQVLCEEKSLTLNWHISDNITTWMNADKNKFSKILQKLLDNAIKFTDVGAITVIVKYEYTNGKGILNCTIKDTGAGISTEQQQHIFDAFWQEDSGFTRRYDGLGIGLTISQKLIQLLGGKIDIVSSRNSGTIFTITLPVDEVADPLLTSTLPTITHSILPILVVEDNLINQEILSMMLRKLGYQCIIANDGIEALELLDEQIPSLILMDLQMPRMDGFACTRAIRQRTDQCRDITIIAISANMMESQQTACKEAGMNSYLAKPIELPRLKHTLELYLSTDNSRI